MNRKLLLSFLMGTSLVLGCTGDNDDTNQPSCPVKDATYDTIDSFVVDSGRDALPEVPNSFDVGTDTTEDSQDYWNLQTPVNGAITYHGGMVFTQPTNIYFIWYGDWSSSPNAKAILGELINNIDTSPWYEITKQYYQVGDTGPDVSADAEIDWDAGKSFVTNKVVLANSIDVGYTHSDYLTDNDIQRIVSDAIDSGQLISDNGGIYFVLTSKDVKQTYGWSSFGQNYCGYHGAFWKDGINLKYSFVGDLEYYLYACSTQEESVAKGYLSSPNNDWGVDAMASVIAHELSETLTDGNINAWYKNLGYYQPENADSCAWRFSPVYVTPSNSIANMKIGERNYLIQQNWVMDVDGGRCDLHL